MGIEVLEVEQRRPRPAGEDRRAVPVVGAFTALDEPLRVGSCCLQVGHNLLEAVPTRRFRAPAIPVTSDIDRRVQVEAGDVLKDLATATLALTLQMQPALTGHEQAVHSPTELASVCERNNDAREEVPPWTQALVDERQPLCHDFAFFGFADDLKIWSATVVAASASMPSTTWL